MPNMISMGPKADTADIASEIRGVGEDGKKTNGRI
jgi:hypothetical protein